MTAWSMEKAQRALASARILLAADDTDGAANRAYCAMFEAALAGLAWIGAGAADVPRHRTHGGLITSFGQQFVRTGRLPTEFGRSLNRVQELRLAADYFTGSVSREKAIWAIEEAERFVAGVRHLLNESSPDTLS
jgi:uncharacterized protein (UPF0332 family)